MSHTQRRRPTTNSQAFTTARQYQNRRNNSRSSVLTRKRPQETSSKITLLAFQHLVILLAALAPIALLGVTVAVPGWWNASSYSHSLSFSHCNYDGTFTPYNHRTLSLWKPSGFFQINLFWGHMTFSLAKFLDVGFDLIIGRGLQAVLAIITYKVSAKVLSEMMESTTVSYQTFEAVAFVSPTLAKTGNLAAEMLMNRTLQARMTMFLLFLSSAFVLAFPTLTSAMSGYSNNMIARFQTLDGQTVSWSDVHVVQFTIDNGTRLGTPGSVPIHSSLSCLFQGPGMSWTANNSGLIYRRAEDEDDGEYTLWNTVPPSCRPFWRTVEYISQYGINAPASTSSEYYFGDQEFNLEPPTLNISTSYDSSSIEVLKEVFSNSLHNMSTTLSSLESVMGTAIRPNATFIFDNRTFDFAYAQEHSFCQPTHTHNWGFSFLFLFITVLLLSLWSIAMYGMWLNAYLYSTLDRSGRTMGSYRASFDLVQAMQQDPSIGLVRDSDGEEEIRRLVSRRRRLYIPFDQGGLTYRQLHREKQQTRYDELKMWLSSRSKQNVEGTEKTFSNGTDRSSPTGGSTASSRSAPQDGQGMGVSNTTFQFRNIL